MKEEIQSQLQPRSSQNAITTATTSKHEQERHRVIGEVLDRWRINLGWKPLDAESQRVQRRHYLAELDALGVHYRYFHELYSRALILRAAAIAKGYRPPDFGVELLIAAWIGEEGLANEIAERERNSMIDSGRFLSSSPNEGMVRSECIPPEEGLKIVERVLAEMRQSKLRIVENANE